MSPRLRHIIRQRDLEDIRRSTEELTRRQQSPADPSNLAASTPRRNRSDWRVVYGDASGTQTVLPPIEDLVSRSNSERVRATGYRQPYIESESGSGSSSLRVPRIATAVTQDRADRRARLRSILPPLPDNSDEAIDIEMSNQRMDETDDQPFVYRYINPNYGRATDLEVLLGGDDHELDFARARRPSHLRHSATAESGENHSETAAAVRDIDAAELRWIDSLYQQFPSDAQEALSPHVRAVLNRHPTDAIQPVATARDTLWNMMMHESQTDDEEEDDSDWEVPSSSGEVHSEGRTPRAVGEILADLMGAARRLDTRQQTEHRFISPTPSRPATNVHQRAEHEPVVVGSNSRLTNTARAPIRGDPRPTAGDQSSSIVSAESGPALRRRKSIKRRRIESGMDIPYPHATLTAATSEPISKENLPEYMQIISAPVLAIPTSFSPLDKCSRLSISPASTPALGYGPLVVVRFTGTGARGDADAAAVRTDHPISPACGIYYYEATIVSKGQEGFISIGFSNRLTNLSRLVGWEPGSFAWHMDDGFVFEGRGEGTSMGWPTSTTGDVIGCGIDFSKGQAFFTKNGQFIGYAFKNVGKEDRLYPSVGLRTPGETLKCNFSGPFKYDIAEHVRRTQLDIVQQVLRQDHVVIRASADEKSSTSPFIQASTVTDVNSVKSASSNNPALPAASPQKVIRNIDGALAPAVLSYLQRNGFSASASAMRKDMGWRKRLLETGLGDPSEARTKKLARTAGWYEAQERGWQELQQIKREYREEKFSLVWRKLQAIPRTHSGRSFLESDSSLWACRLRVRCFSRVFRESLLDEDAGINTTSQNGLSLPELNSDADFRRFIVGEAHLPPNSAEECNRDRSDVLLAIGRNLQSEHGQSPNPIVQQEIQKALSFMVYHRMSDLPKDMFNTIAKASVAEEAEQLFKAIRSYEGKPTSSALESAFSSVDSTLIDLGRLHRVSAATFLSVREVIQLEK
ncbi:hypothetical protein NliqN6_1188 [Naganishia liquefaciens]|uniref:B30.2/SPRY domain-containing protein n=1 Tax=Naganishia liquefaciens TaxID=104408 RepID=A0A8H3TPY2_9TREE|nr:hypothetical protein NliqN6_1188 [Naganishia liquefaciens]